MLDQKIPDCLIKIMFLVEVEITIRSNIKYRFGVMSFKLK